jgi:hypothetical protein
VKAIPDGRAQDGQDCHVLGVEPLQWVGTVGGGERIGHVPQ